MAKPKIPNPFSDYGLNEPRLKELLERATSMSVTSKNFDFDVNGGARERYTIDLVVDRPREFSKPPPSIDYRWDDDDYFRPGSGGTYSNQQYQAAMDPKLTPYERATRLLDATGNPIENEEAKFVLATESLMKKLRGLESLVKAKDTEIARLNRCVSEANAARENAKAVLDEIDKVVVAASKNDTTPLRQALAATVMGWAASMKKLYPQPDIAKKFDERVKPLLENLVTTVSLLLVRGTEVLRPEEETKEEPIIKDRQLF